VELSKEQRQTLHRRAAGQTRPHREVLRASVLLALEDDPSPTAVASKLGIDRKTARRWRDRFLEQGLEGLEDRERSGRPVRIASETRCHIIGMACAKPSEHGEPTRTNWTYEALLQQFRRRHPDVEIGRTSIVRVLLDADIRVHRMKYWCHSKDVRFREKVADICPLYLSPPPGSTVICVDEKPGIQALGRPFPVKPPAPGEPGRIDSNYVRNGTHKLLAAFNPHDGELFGQMRETCTAKDLVEFMEACAEHWPHGDIHVVWDNLNIHFDGPDKRWTRFNERHGGRFHFHYTPIHASWMNQVELWFGILQRRVLKYGVFDSLADVDEAVLQFINHWNECEKHPFRWTFKGYPLQTGARAA